MKRNEQKKNFDAKRTKVQYYKLQMLKEILL